MDGGCLSGMRRRTRRRRIAATRHGVRRLEGLDPFFPGGSPAAPPDAALHLCAKQRLLPPQRPARSNCERGAPERDARQALESHCAAHESWSVRHGCRLRLAVLHSTGAWQLSARKQTSGEGPRSKCRPCAGYVRARRRVPWLHSHERPVRQRQREDVCSPADLSESSGRLLSLPAVPGSALNLLQTSSLSRPARTPPSAARLRRWSLLRCRPRFSPAVSRGNDGGGRRLGVRPRCWACRSDLCPAKQM